MLAQRQRIPPEDVGRHIDLGHTSRSSCGFFFHLSKQCALDSWRAPLMYVIYVCRGGLWMLRLRNSGQDLDVRKARNLFCSFCLRTLTVAVRTLSSGSGCESPSMVSSTEIQ